MVCCVWFQSLLVCHQTNNEWIKIACLLKFQKVELCQAHIVCTLYSKGPTLWTLNIYTFWVLLDIWTILLRSSSSSSCALRMCIGFGWPSEPKFSNCITFSFNLFASVWNDRSFSVVAAFSIDAASWKLFELKNVIIQSHSGDILVWMWWNWGFYFFLGTNWNFNKFT